MTARLQAALLAFSVVLLAPQTTPAHFVLQSPASWRVQGPLGDPQKTGPCGDEGGAPTTGVVTPFSPGETITITIDETIFHPGHYRVALAVYDRSELPAEPPVTPGNTPCGSAPIADPPTYPVLADGALQHTEAFDGLRFIQVTLPSDVTCTRCTLQVLEFMTEHGDPCFYHHCADISIGVGSAGCTTNDECADDNVCTSDTCNPTTKTCEHVDTVTATCDDGNACTQDACSAMLGCVAQPITSAEAASEFVRVSEGPSCAPEDPPRAIGALAGRADAFVARARLNPTKATPHLRRALAKLRKAGKRLTKVQKRSLSAGCVTALRASVETSQARVQCLLTASEEPG